VTRLNGKQFVINSDLIETMEATPDTVVLLTTGNKYVLLESLDTLIDRIAVFRRRCRLADGVNKEDQGMAAYSADADNWGEKSL
jgi:flagellar protein FlbD